MAHSCSLPNGRIPADWPKHVNRFRHREQGAVILIRNFGLIRKAQSAPERRQLRFFVTGHEEDATLGWVIVEKPALKPFESFARAVDAVVEAVGAAPETCSEWAEQQQAGASDIISRSIATCLSSIL